MSRILLLLALGGCVTTATVLLEDGALTDPDPDTDRDTDPDTDPAEIDEDGDGWLIDEDCDDRDPHVNPGAEEQCDAVDWDCDGNAYNDGACPCEDVELADDGWFTVTCHQPRPWPAARNLCDDAGLQLVMITDEGKSGRFQDFAARKLGEDVWIGLSDREEEGEFRWVDDSLLRWDNFAWGEPNDYGRGEDCVEQLNWSGRWNDAECREERPFVCEGI